MHEAEGVRAEGVSLVSVPEHRCAAWNNNWSSKTMWCRNVNAIRPIDAVIALWQRRPRWLDGVIPSGANRAGSAYGLGHGREDGIRRELKRVATIRFGVSWQVKGHSRDDHGQV